MAATAPKVALITGANGITGSAILEYIVTKTTKDQWSRIIATSRSPFQTEVTDSRVEFLAIDLTESPKELVAKMKTVCEPVTHAFFSSYVHKDDFAELNKANSALFENFLAALIDVAPHLQNVTLQTGGKHYGVHLGPVPSPAREEEPRKPATIDNFYFPQEDALIAAQSGKSWSWNVVRPEAIVGTTMKPNGMNSALTYALYILTCKQRGEEPRMPTNQIYWDGYDDCSFAPMIADFTIFASTNPACANEAFNIVNGDSFCWRYMWPRLTSYFGVTTSSDYTFQKSGLKEGVPHLEISLAEWANTDSKTAWEQLCEKENCPEAKKTWESGTWQYQDWVFGRSWSATLSMSKVRKFGYTGYIDSYDAFVETFERMKRLKQIPS